MSTAPSSGGRRAQTQRGKELIDSNLNLCPLSTRVGERRGRRARFGAWVGMCCGRRRGGGGVGAARDCRGSLLVGALRGPVAADAEVGGCVFHRALQGDDHALQETFEGVDVTGIQVLVGVVQACNHGDEQEELE